MNAPRHPIWSGWGSLLAVIGTGFAGVAAPASGEREIPRDEPRSTQRVIRTAPPAAPEATPTDPGAPLPPPRRSTGWEWQMHRDQGSAIAALPPGQFNPDPGALQRPVAASAPPYFQPLESALSPPEAEPVPPDRALPRAPLEHPRITEQPERPPVPFVADPIPPALQLPRDNLRENRFLPFAWLVPDRYPRSEAGRDLPAFAVPQTDRWRQTGFVPWRRYTGGETEESPFTFPAPASWHYYRQSVLKGDLPIRGDDVFLALTASSDVVFEERRLLAAEGGGSAGAREFRSNTLAVNFGFQADLFRGATVFKPVDWRVRLKPVMAFQHASFHGANPRPANVTKPDLVLQEISIEKHLRDLSPNYDFVSLRVGAQTFNSDFRGFVFNDTNFGARVFGNSDNNRWQYNAALFDLREKDASTDLNTFERRGQVVAIANAYRQDFGLPGYTTQLSFHASLDPGDQHRDTRGVMVRPAPLGLARPHRVNSFYLGWAGDGHLNRWNASHAAYVVMGRDDLNGLARQPVDVFAQMAAIEVSYDRDWMRWRASLFYASGDHDATDGRATGFDSIVDNANFTGGPFSYYVRQGLGPGRGVGLKQRFSLLPNLRTSKAGGQQSFVNPGLVLGGLGADFAVTPRWRVFTNVNYVQFATTGPVCALLGVPSLNRTLGADLSCGVQWRPLLTENIVVSAGCGLLRPARGYRDILSAAAPPPAVGVASAAHGAGGAEWLHSVIVALTFIH